MSDPFRDEEYSNVVDVDDVRSSSIVNNDEKQSLLLLDDPQHDETRIIAATENRELRSFVAALQAQVNRLEQRLTVKGNVGVLPEQAVPSDDDDDDEAMSSSASVQHRQQSRQQQRVLSVTRAPTVLRRATAGGGEFQPHNRHNNRPRASRSSIIILPQQQEDLHLQNNDNDNDSIAHKLQQQQQQEYEHEQYDNKGGIELILKTLNEDTFDFLLATPTCSPPFWLAVFVLLFQVAIFTLMATNLLQIDQFGKNVFGIPANVTEAVWIAQIIAIIIAVVTQQDGIRTGLDMLREGYGVEMQRALPEMTVAKFVGTVFMRLFEGSLGLTVNFLLIVTSDTVIDLLLNFTALAFVSQLGAATFFLCKQGFAGKTCLEQSVRLSEVEYPVPKGMVQARKTCMMVTILLVMMVAWGVVRFHQTSGHYLCSTLLIQMGADQTRPELATFSGLYDLQVPDRLGFRSHHVQYVDRHAQKTRFAFCQAQHYWTLQWYSSSNDDNNNLQEWDNDPCTNYHARSAETNTFDLSQTALDGDWYVRDELDREMILEPFFLHCFDCGNTLNGMTEHECTQDGRGTCSNAVCECDAEWYGLRCEFRAPCPELALDAGTAGFTRHDPLRETTESHLNILYYNDETTTTSNMVQVYHRPVYVGHYIQGHYDVLFFTGRRWAHTHTGLLPVNITTSAATNEKEAEQMVAHFFVNHFHAHWSQFSVEYLSEPMDLGMPSDATSPTGVQWYMATLKTHPNQTEMQSANEAAKATDALFICATCNEQDNPCRFDGVCSKDGTCQCSLGAHGSMCEKSPVGNGRCDSYYNEPEFEFDAGDCCDSTCVSTPEFTCGEDLNGHVNMGYFHCKLPENRWQLVGAPIVGDPMSLAGYSVALSHSGTLLAVGEPQQGRVKLFDKDGANWILREVLQGPPDSHFGLSLDLSGGAIHWRNNPTFRAPLILAVGVQADEEPATVEIYSCGFDRKCQKMDTFTNVNGKTGPEAFDISDDGRVIAFGSGNPGTVETYELMGRDYYLGTKMTRSPVYLAANRTENNVYGVKLSENGDHLLTTASTGSGLVDNVSSAVHIHTWDGSSYSLRGDIIFETEAEILQRQLALSGDGNVAVIGVSDCTADVHQIEVLVWDDGTSTWEHRESPPLHARECRSSFAAWSVAVNHDGTTLAVSAYPDSAMATAYYWNGTQWQIIGKEIESAVLGGSEPSLALSSDGAHLVLGLPFAGMNEAGVVSMYSIPTGHCPSDASHHFRLSLTTDYEPENTFWTLEEAGSGTIVMHGGPYEYPIATLVEKTCLDTSLCHVFTIYNPVKREGLEQPGRFDLFLDGKDVDRVSFRNGMAKRVFVGDGCTPCPSGTRLLRMLVHATCQQHVEWSLVHENGTEVASGQISDMDTCDTLYQNSSFYWKDTCIDDSACYTFTVSDKSLDANDGVEYLLLYDDDIQVAYGQQIATSASSQIGNCPDNK